jgi:hypothetical protein
MYELTCRRSGSESQPSIPTVWDLAAWLPR